MLKRLPAKSGRHLRLFEQSLQSAVRERPNMFVIRSNAVTLQRCSVEFIAGLPGMVVRNDFTDAYPRETDNGCKGARHNEQSFRYRPG